MLKTTTRALKHHHPLHRETPLYYITVLYGVCIVLDGLLNGLALLLVAASSTHITLMSDVVVKRRCSV